MAEILTLNGSILTNNGNALTIDAPSPGPVSSVAKQVNFIDYDGTILYSYTKAEFNDLSELPANPSHEGLTSQGWNWTMAQIIAQLTAVPGGDVWVGQMYITESGDTEIDVRFPDSARLSPILTIAVNGTVTVDWGDGTTPDNVTGSSLTTKLAVPHTYSATGEYTIKIHIESGEFQFIGTSSYYLLRKNTSGEENRVYSNCILAVRLGDGVTSIGNYAFNYCGSLASVTIPSAVTSIGNTVFSNCYSLASITFPSGVTSILTNAFSYCQSLVSVAIPSGVTSISNYAFNYCYSLASITFPSAVTSIGIGAFTTCYSLASVTIPNTVTDIGNTAFNNCVILPSIVIPSGVTSIESNAFSSCYSLASVTIPNTVTSIGSTAFSYCKGVAEFHIESTAPPTLGTNAFNSIASDCKIYVPAASLEAYQTAANWSTYASYMVGE